jgi:hypothetical protein
VLDGSVSDFKVDRWRKGYIDRGFNHRADAYQEAGIWDEVAVGTWWYAAWEEIADRL